MPEIHVSFVEVVSSSTIEAPLPPTNLVLSITMALESLSVPERLSLAPSISVPPVDCLLKSTFVNNFASSTITIRFVPATDFPLSSFVTVI